MGLWLPLFSVNYHFTQLYGLNFPAGMELFQAGSETQKNTIQRWIDESDVYLLILGGRYGSIEPITDKSYTHWEYEYAGQAGKPRFAVVISDEALRIKGQQNIDFIERQNYAKYEEFKKEVLSHMSKFFNDSKDIKLAIQGALTEIMQLHPNLPGWVRGNDVSQIIKELEAQISTLKQEMEQRNSFGQPPTPRYIPVNPHKRIKGKYLKFLVSLYKATDGRQNSIVNMSELGSEIGFSGDETDKIAQFLKEEGLLKFVTLGGGISITHEGIVFMEDILEPLEEITDLERHIISQLSGNRGSATLSLNELILNFESNIV